MLLKRLKGDVMQNLKNSKFNVFCIDKNIICVFNTLTGSIVELTKFDYNALKTGNLELISDSIDVLKEQGILIDSDFDEISLLRNTYSYCKYNEKSAQITICPTMECNFSCPYCYETRESGHMSEETQDSVIHFLHGIISSGITEIFVTWYGGEPLLYPDIIERISLKIKKMCCEKHIKCVFSMITNGYLITPKNVLMFKKINLSKIQITLDGNAETHNKRRKLKNGGKTYDVIINNIKSLESTDIDVIVRVNIDKSNKLAFEDVRKTFENFKYVFCYPSIVTEEKTQKEDQRNLCFKHNEVKDYYKDHLTQETSLNDIDTILESGVRNCIAEHCNSYVIDHKGYIYKCLNDLGNKEYAIASITGEKVNGYKAISKYLGRDPFTEIECNNCAYLPLCYGGCIWEFLDKGSHMCPPEKFLLKNFILEKIKTNT